MKVTATYNQPKHSVTLKKIKSDGTVSGTFTGLARHIRVLLEHMNRNWGKLCGSVFKQPDWARVPNTRVIHGGRGSKIEAVLKSGESGDPVADIIEKYKYKGKTCTKRITIPIEYNWMISVIKSLKKQGCP